MKHVNSDKVATEHRNITISGHVQGVGFRYHANKMAKIYGINGFVKNMPNGDVYIEAEGTDTQLDNFIRWCYQGPARAYISDVNITSGEVVFFSYFDVKF